VLGRQRRLASGTSARPAPSNRIAQPQVLMADALRAGQQRIVELHRMQVEVPLHVLEPFQRVSRSRLQLQHFQPPGLLILVERSRHVRFGVQVFRQRDGAFQRQLGARSDGEMRACRRIAHQDKILVAPAFAQHTRKPGSRPNRAGAWHCSSAHGHRDAWRISSRRWQSSPAGSCVRSRSVDRFHRSIRRGRSQCRHRTGRHEPRPSRAWFSSNMKVKASSNFWCVPSQI
jgi:hypothetical protein